MIKVINPSNSETLASIAPTTDKELDSALKTARNSFDSGVWRDSTFAERREMLLAISSGILEQAQELAETETLNTGKPIKETTFMDIPSSAKTFEHFANNLEEYLAPETVGVEQARGELVFEPQGVVVLIVPWNYPLLIASWKLAQALAAGNCVLLKPSSLTPLTAMKLAAICKNAGLPQGVLSVVNGGGSSLGRAICADPRVDMISFTGSPEAGRQILGYTAENVKKTIMELGGKSAALVLEDADLELAVNGSLCSIFLNQGQMCTAMSRIFVHEKLYPAFLEEFSAKARKIKLGRGLDHETQMGPLISAIQREKVAAMVDTAVKEGAELVCGGRIPQSPELKNGFFFEPTVLTGVPAGAAIFREEVFGPVAIVNRFSSPEEAVRLANSSDFALACSIWSQDLDSASRLASRINAGTVWINTYGMFHNELPYGGFKQSGFGKELGKYGLREYSRLKNMVIDKTEGSKPLVNFWYGF